MLVTYLSYVFCMHERFISVTYQARPPTNSHSQTKLRLPYFRFYKPQCVMILGIAPFLFDLDLIPDRGDDRPV
jgi:hypothetical protein